MLSIEQRCCNKLHGEDFWQGRSLREIVQLTLIAALNVNAVYF